jgi:hypothetical protein
MQQPSAADRTRMSRNSTPSARSMSTGDQDPAPRPAITQSRITVSV